MQQESKTYRYRIRQWLETRKSMKIIWMVLLAILAIYLSILLVMPRLQVRRLDLLYATRQDVVSSPAVISDHPEIFTLQKKKAFLESRLKMTRSDSIGLAVNLPDSMVTLEINGIILHRAKINSYRTSKVLRAVSQETCLGMFSEPLRIMSHHATIEKVPVIYRKAPKDSIEAAEYLAEVPDTMLKKPPLVILSSDYDIQLYFYPYENLSFGGKLVKFMFNTLQELRIHLHYLSSIVRLRIPDYHSRIKIYMTDREIISLYRALPENARLTIML